MKGARRSPLAVISLRSVRQRDGAAEVRHQEHLVWRSLVRIREADDSGRIDEREVRGGAWRTALLELLDLDSAGAMTAAVAGAGFAVSWESLAAIGTALRDGRPDLAHHLVDHAALHPIEEESVSQLCEAGHGQLLGLAQPDLAIDIAVARSSAKRPEWLVLGTVSWRRVDGRWWCLQPAGSGLVQAQPATPTDLPGSIARLMVGAA